MNLVILAKTAVSRNFWRNRRNRSFCWAPFYLIYHLHLVILAKTAMSPFFRNFGEIAGIAKSQFLLGTLLPHLTLDLINFSKSFYFSNFHTFWRNDKLQKSQFLLGTFLPPLPLEFRNFSKNCDFSNFLQFLLLRENLDISRSFWVGVSCWDPGTLSLCQSLYKCNFSALF